MTQKINLFVNRYQCGNKERQKELDFCFNTNIKSGLFSNIIPFSGRPTYNDFFEKTKEYPNDINVIANSDIYFNETLNLVQGMQTNESYALTRWEIEEGEIVSFSDKHFYNKEAKPKHSQDVWVFNGAVENVQGPFNLGIPGCDNRIAYEISLRYKLTNPSNRIQCIHNHKESERNYNIPEGYKQRVSPPYKWVDVGSESITTRRKGI